MLICYDDRTGIRTGDDWNLSENGFDKVLTVKTSYPHHEGTWQWRDVMDDVVLLVRNPRYAIPSYFNMKNELEFSTTWDQSYLRRPFTYTYRGEVNHWINWRNRNWYRQMNKWCFQIDFWMEGGLYGNYTDIGPLYSWHCAEGRHMADCHPKAIIQFEKLHSDDNSVGATEALKIASLLDGFPNMTVIESDARECMYKEVMNRPEFYNRNRDGHGSTPDLMIFHYTHLDHMSKRLEEYIEKYSTGKWINDSNAQVLVLILQEYFEEVEAEYQFAASEYYAVHNFTQPRVNTTL